MYLSILCKGYRKIIDIWKTINKGSDNRLGIVRDSDNQNQAQQEHEKQVTDKVFICTTKEKTLEPEIVSAGENSSILKDKYGDDYNWNDMTAEDLAIAKQ